MNDWLITLLVDENYNMKYLLTKANAEAIRFACVKFHYSKRVPVNSHWYNVYILNEAEDQWEGNHEKHLCWVIIFWSWANNNLAKSVNLKQWQVYELTRVALNWKQENVSEPLAIALKLFKKDVPLCKMIVSYADEAQWHKWGIYQATNRIYLWKVSSQSAVDPEDWKIKHTRTLHSKYWSIKGFKLVKDAPKHRYVYPLDTETRKLMWAISWQKYPKKAQ